MKKLILISALIAFAVTAGAAIIPNQSTPAGTVETFLRALQRLDGESIWQVLNNKLKDEFTKEFNELKKNGEIDEFVEQFNAPYLRESRDAHQFMVNLFQATRQAYPEECAELSRMLSDESIRSLLDSGKLEEKGNKAYIEIEELGEISLVKEGTNWKLAELDGFDIFDF